MGSKFGDSKLSDQDWTDLKEQGRFVSSDGKHVTITLCSEETVFVHLESVFENITGLLCVSLTLCYAQWSRHQQHQHPLGMC